MTDQNLAIVLSAICIAGIFLFWYYAFLPEQKAKRKNISDGFNADEHFKLFYADIMNCKTLDQLECAFQFILVFDNLFTKHAPIDAATKDELLDHLWDAYDNKRSYLYANKSSEFDVLTSAVM